MRSFGAELQKHGLAGAWLEWTQAEVQSLLSYAATKTFLGSNTIFNFLATPFIQWTDIKVDKSLEPNDFNESTFTSSFTM